MLMNGKTVSSCKNLEWTRLRLSKEEKSKSERRVFSPQGRWNCKLSFSSFSSSPLLHMTVNSVPGCRALEGGPTMYAVTHLTVLEAADEEDPLSSELK